MGKGGKSAKVINAKRKTRIKLGFGDWPVGKKYAKYAHVMADAKKERVEFLKKLKLERHRLVVSMTKEEFKAIERRHDTEMKAKIAQWDKEKLEGYLAYIKARKEKELAKKAQIQPIRRGVLTKGLEENGVKFREPPQPSKDNPFLQTPEKKTIEETQVDKMARRKERLKRKADKKAQEALRPSKEAERKAKKLEEKRLLRKITREGKRKLKERLEKEGITVVKKAKKNRKEAYPWKEPAEAKVDPEDDLSSSEDESVSSTPKDVSSSKATSSGKSESEESSSDEASSDGSSSDGSSSDESSSDGSSSDGSSSDGSSSDGSSSDGSSSDGSSSD